MKAVIPVKGNSSRIPNKNFKEFHNGQSLFDITASKLVKALPPEDIYMSCEDPEQESLAKKWGINFILRDEYLTDNNTPFYDVFNGVCSQVEGNEDIAWCQVIDPLFDSYEDCFDTWNNGEEKLIGGAWTRSKIQKSHDSLVVVYPFKKYTLNENYEPQGFGFGNWHKKSQILPRKYELTFTLSILTRECINNIGYYVGKTPYWYHADNQHIDIDTEQDFKLAQIMYSSF